MAGRAWDKADRRVGLCEHHAVGLHQRDAAA
jgi:hypothetical protein